MEIKKLAFLGFVAVGLSSNLWGYGYKEFGYKQDPYGGPPNLTGKGYDSNEKKAIMQDYYMEKAERQQREKQEIKIQEERDKRWK